MMRKSANTLLLQCHNHKEEEGPVSTCFRCFEISVYFPVEQQTSWKTTKTLLVFIFISKIQIKILSDALSAVAWSWGLAVISVHQWWYHWEGSTELLGVLGYHYGVFFAERTNWESQSHSNTKQKAFWNLKKHPQNINMTLCTVVVSRLSN